MAAMYEYLEVDLHGDSGARADARGDSSRRGEGRSGYIDALNFYGSQGWEMVWMDRDTTVHIIAILKRERSDFDKVAVVSKEPHETAGEANG